MSFRNCENYPDPTAGLAIARVACEQRRQKQSAKRKNRKKVERFNEKDPWKDLANAIVMRAVEDYRNRTRMMNQISRQLKKKSLTPDEKAFLFQRYEYYERLQDDAGDFFFSDLFSSLCELDGYDVLDRLNREVKR